MVTSLRCCCVVLSCVHGFVGYLLFYVFFFLPLYRPLAGIVQRTTSSHLYFFRIGYFNVQKVTLFYRALSHSWAYILVAVLLYYRLGTEKLARSMSVRLSRGDCLSPLRNVLPRQFHGRFSGSCRRANGRKLCSMQSPMISVSRYPENIVYIDS